jgi:hypothetical protein
VSITIPRRETRNEIDSSTMSEAEVASHEILTRQLVALLGFDDGADDVLDHLLTVESSEVSAKIVFVGRPAPHPFRR